MRTNFIQNGSLFQTFQQIDRVDENAVLHVKWFLTVTAAHFHNFWSIVIGLAEKHGLFCYWGVFRFLQTVPAVSALSLIAR